MRNALFSAKRSTSTNVGGSNYLLHIAGRAGKTLCGRRSAASNCYPSGGPPVEQEEQCCRNCAKHYYREPTAGPSAERDFGAMPPINELIARSSLGDRSEPTPEELSVAMDALAEIEASGAALPPVSHVGVIDYATGKLEQHPVFDRVFLEHAVKTGSQYDRTCRRMAAHILALLDHAARLAHQYDHLLKEIETCAEQRNELRRALAARTEDCEQLRKAHQAALQERDNLAIELGHS